MKEDEVILLCCWRGRWAERGEVYMRAQASSSPWCLIACTAALESALACPCATSRRCFKAYKEGESMSNSLHRKNRRHKSREGQRCSMFTLIVVQSRDTPPPKKGKCSTLPTAFREVLNFCSNSCILNSTCLLSKKSLGTKNKGGPVGKFPQAGALHLVAAYPKHPQK